MRSVIFIALVVVGFLANPILLLQAGEKRIRYELPHRFAVDEANLNIFDAAFAREQVKVFEEDKAQSRLMARAEFKNRSAVGKLLDSLAGLFRRQL